MKNKIRSIQFAKRDGYIAVGFIMLGVGIGMLSIPIMLIVLGASFITIGFVGVWEVNKQ